MKTMSAFTNIFAISSGGGGTPAEAAPGTVVRQTPSSTYIGKNFITHPQHINPQGAGDTIADSRRHISGIREYEDPADKPRDLSAYAYYKPQTVLTDKDGVARTTLHLPDEHVKSWILCHQTSYDLSARKRMGRYHKPVPEHELQADYRTSFTYFTLDLRGVVEFLDVNSNLRIKLDEKLDGGRLHLTLTSPHDFGRNRVTLKEFLTKRRNGSGGRTR
jgi:hypothetical protein